MKTEQEIRDKIKELDGDERYHYPPANVFINAPLALVQVNLESHLAALSWVLGIETPKPGPKKSNHKKGLI